MGLFTMALHQVYCENWRFVSKFRFIFQQNWCASEANMKETVMCEKFSTESQSTFKKKDRKRTNFGANLNKFEVNLKLIWRTFETNLKQIWNSFETHLKQTWDKFETNLEGL